MKKLLFIILLCSAATAAGPIIDSYRFASAVSAGLAFDAPSSGTALASTSVTVSHTCTGANRALFVTTASTLNTDCTAATYNGVAMTPLWESHASGYGNTTSGWILVAPATGTHNIVATFSGTDTCFLVASSWTGVDQVTPTRTVYTGSAISSAATLTVADAVSGDFVLDGYGFFAYGTEPAHTGTLVAKLTSASHRCGGQYKSAVGSTVMNWTSADVVWDGGAFALVPD